MSVNQCALRRNAKKVSGTARLIAVIKADAYGHGAAECAETMRSIADMFAVATENEALRLLGCGETKDILILHPCARPHISSDKVIYTLTAPQDAERFAGRRTAVKLNTGMNRFGADDNSRALLRESMRLTRVHSVYTHLRCPSDNAITDAQYDSFGKMTAGVRLPLHIAASNALDREKSSPHEYVRCGIALYGGISGFERVMTVTAEVLETRVLHAGDGVGYGCGTVCRDMRAAVLDIGYAHGYPKNGRRRYVFLGGRKRRVLAVCMDCMIVECGENDKRGDVAEITGRHITPQELADACGTVTYEIFTSLGKITDRTYDAYD